MRSTSRGSAGHAMRLLLSGALVVSLAAHVVIGATNARSDEDDRGRKDRDGEHSPIRHVVVIFQENVSFDHEDHPRAPQLILSPVTGNP